MNYRAHPDDILIAANLDEARQYIQFSQRQMFTVDLRHRLEGRRFRKVWVTDRALWHGNWPLAHHVLLSATRLAGNGEEAIQSVANWKAEPLSLIEQIQRLPEQNASPSRDYGRGYSKACKDILELLVSAAVE